MYTTSSANCKSKRIHRRRPRSFVTIWLGLALFAGRVLVAADSVSLPVAAPEGWTVTRVAGPPLVNRPLFGAWDPEGHLYVIDSGGTNEDGRGTKPPDVIRRLDDTDGDGVFDQSHLFADRIVFGTGLVWHQGNLFVSSPPSLWRLRDTNDDGVADERHELATGFAFNQSCSDDLHGACLGLDGRIYFLPGRFHHRITLPNGEILRDATGPWLMRCRPDGSQMEFVSGSVGNPVEVDFLPNGDAFVQGTYWAKPSAGGGLRDAVIHSVEGAEYSVRDRDYSDRTRTGEFLPELVAMPATAPSGCCVYRSSGLDAPDQYSLFGAYFNTGSIQRHVLQPVGASYQATSTDFLRATREDVHFTDVFEDADGSLLAIDTGGWFRKCCPTSKIAKPEILGAIYRVQRVQDRPLADARGVTLEWHRPAERELLARLDDPRWMVRQRATHALAARGAASVTGLSEILRRRPTTTETLDQSRSASSPLTTEATDRSFAASEQQRVAAVWALTQIDDHSARLAVHQALEDPATFVRQAAANSIGLHRDLTAWSGLEHAASADPSPAVRRDARLALSRLDLASKPDHRARSIAQLFSAQATHESEEDPFLAHASTWLLIRANDPQATRTGLTHTHPLVQRTALIALDQMVDGQLQAADVVPFLTPSRSPLRDAALTVVTRHPEWAEALLPTLRTWLADPDESGDRQVALAAVVRTFRDAPQFGRWVSEQSGHWQTLAPPRLNAWIETLATSGIENAPPSWDGPLLELLQHADPTVRQTAVRALGQLRVSDSMAALGSLARKEDEAFAVRVAALRSLIDLQGPLEATDWNWLVEQTQPARPLPERLAALEVMAASVPPLEIRQTLAARVATAGPVEWPHLLRILAREPNDTVGFALIENLEQATYEFPVELIDETLAGYSPQVLSRAAPLLSRWKASQQEQATRLERLADAVAPLAGDPSRGRSLFFEKANCHLCHRVGTTGGQVGPDLSEIGSIRAPRDLLEAIAFPSASFARGYEPVSLELTDGRIVSGLMGRETDRDVVVIGVEQNRPVEIVVPRESIEDASLGRVSLMPAGLDQTLAAQELADLLAFLGQLKKRP